VSGRVQFKVADKAKSPDILEPYFKKSAHLYYQAVNCRDTNRNFEHTAEIKSSLDDLIGRMHHKGEIKYPLPTLCQANETEHFVLWLASYISDT
jgi:hypothetical protein